MGSQAFIKVPVNASSVAEVIDQVLASTPASRLQVWGLNNNTPIGDISDSVIPEPLIGAERIGISILSVDQYPDFSFDAADSQMTRTFTVTKSGTRGKVIDSVTNENIFEETDLTIRSVSSFGHFVELVQKGLIPFGAAHGYYPIRILLNQIEGQCGFVQLLAAVEEATAVGEILAVVDVPVAASGGQLFEFGS